jgi:hypothetical protein
MNSKEFEKLVRDFFEENCIGLMIGKRLEYACDDEVFRNFKKAGKRRGNCPEEALMGMKEKQSTSIDDMIIDLNLRHITDCGAKLNKYELAIWQEKIRDDINYLFLLWGLLNERLEKE